jgi:CHAT domain-containing protein
VKEEARRPRGLPGAVLAAAFFSLALARAADGPAADADVVARIAAGDIAGAEKVALGARDDADRLQRIAESFYAAGSPEGIAAAKRCFARALELREARTDAEPEPLAALLHDLSGVRFNEGDFVGAEDAERRSLEIRSRIHPPEDPRTAESRRDLALILVAQGRLAEAAPDLVEALRVIESSPAIAFAQVAVGRNYLAELYRLQGRYGEAASVLEDLVRQAEAKLGPEHPQFAFFLNNLSGVYRDEERFDEAETLLRRSLALRQAATPPDVGAVARATLNIAELHRIQGKLDEAEPLYAEALSLARTALGPQSPELLEFVNQLAVLHREKGQLDKAEPLFRQALDLAERGLGADHPRTAQSVLDLAETLREAGRCREAEPLYRRAVAAREKTLGPSHPDVAEALVSQARCLAGDPSKRGAARAELDRALRILGASRAHPAVSVDALALRAELEHGKDAAGERRDLASALEAVESMRPHRGGGEAVRAEFFSRYRDLYARLLEAEIESGRPDRALVVAERSRARALLDQLAAAHVGPAAPAPRELARREAAARAELAEIRERLAFEQSRADAAPREKAQHLAALERRLDAAERAFREIYDEVKNASPAWRAATSSRPSTVSEIQRDVVPREGWMLVYEIAKEGSYVLAVPPAPGGVEARALVVGPEAAADLGVRPGPLTDATLRDILTGSGSAGVVEHLASPQGPVARGIGGLAEGSDPELSRLHALWRVLVPADLWSRISRAREVLVIPDGPLYLLPLEALVVTPGADPMTTRYWLDEGPPLRYAPSATFVRDLSLRARERRGDRGRAAALSVSDPTFPTGDGAPAPSASDRIRGAYLGGGGVLTRLPGTAAESRAVRDALAPVAEVEVLEGRAARESAVRKALPGKRYLHIATHGLVDERQGALFAAVALAPPESGPPAGDDDGFLELHEIYDLRLDAELAVLSACDSNRGRTVAGEGVFALSRGFLVGGARRVVASEWPVDDASTAELIGELFRRVAESDREGSPVDFARALRDAKRRLRSVKREWAHPFFWAPFILTGAE